MVRLGLSEFLKAVVEMEEVAFSEVAVLKKLFNVLSADTVDIEKLPDLQALSSLEEDVYFYAPPDVCEDFEECNQYNAVFMALQMDNIKGGLEYLLPIRQQPKYL